MRLISRIAAGSLLFFGLFVLGMGTTELLNPDTPAQDREESLAALLLFGVPFTATGSWMFWRAYHQSQQQKQTHLRSTFFNLLKENNGHITALQFSMATGLDGKAAKSYLDDRAKEFDANFNVTTEGNISYYFEIGGSNSNLLDS